MIVLFLLFHFTLTQVDARNASMGREIAILPAAPADQIDVKFRILGHDSIVFTVNDSISQLQKLPLNPSFKTIILIHGWLDTIATARFWWQPILNTVTMFNAHRDYEQGDGYQVIFVDWSRGAGSSYYVPAVSNLRVAAGVLSHMIRILIDDLNFDSSRIRLIGFSLGAHLAGFTGKLLTGRHRLAWITGLDPANALFEMSSPAGSIYKSDARYVDIVHTSSGSVLQGYSKVGPLGCADFYVNGASGNQQSGCEEDMPLGAIGGFFSRRRPCAHDRSPLFFSTLRSLPDCQNIGFACSSYEKFLDGRCASCGPDEEECKLFGFWDDVSSNRWPMTSPDSPVCSHEKLFFNASPVRPCLYHYLLILLTGTMESAAMGSIHISSVTGDVRVEKFYESNKNHTMLIALPNPLDHLRELPLHWDASGNMIDSLLGTDDAQVLRVKRLTLSYLSHTNETIRLMKSMTFCGMKGKTEIRSGSRLIMTRC